MAKEADVYKRQVGTQVEREEFENDKAYFKELDRILDVLFEVAADRGMGWSGLATSSGLSVQTVINLGERWTRRPQFRTVCLIASALGYNVALEAVEGKKRPSLNAK
jgi:hypothetical protein